MAFQNLTTAQTFTVGTRVNSLQIQINTSLTGTITITSPMAGNSTTPPAVRPVAIITNPTAGQTFKYWDLPGGFIVVTNATADITVNWQGNRQAS